jgi:enamine deaminase RidA (YjgF/YER057c/UK114 family)
LRARRLHSSASPFESVYGYSRAVRVGERIDVAGCAPIEPDGASTPGDAGVQAARCLTIIGEALEALGGSFADVVRTRMYITDAADADLVGRAHGAVFGDIRPASTLMLIPAFFPPYWNF